MNNNKYSLLHKASDEHNVYQSINTKKAGWNLLNFNSRILKKDQEWENNTGNYEYGIILMSGDYSVKSDAHYQGLVRSTALLKSPGACMK